MPAWIISYGVWKPLIRMIGRNGRAFSRRIVGHHRLDERLVRGELGTVGQGDRHQVVERSGRDR